jgi:hypothetical protein
LLDLVLDKIYEINWIQPKEYVSLVSTFWAIHDQQYNCQKCKKKQSQSVRDSRKACSTTKETPVVTYGKSEEIKYFTCPSNFYNPAYAILIDMLRHFRQGVLPFEGGLFEQPAKVVDYFNLLENLSYEHQKDIQEEAKKWQKAQSQLNSPLKSRKR